MSSHGNYDKTGGPPLVRQHKAIILHGLLQRYLINITVLSANATMPTRIITIYKKITAPAAGEEGEDYDTLIHQHNQRRKREAAATTKKNYSNVTSTQIASAVSATTAVTANVKTATAKREHQLSIGEDDVLPKKSPTQKQYRYLCSTEGCTNISKNGGVCRRHGAKKKLCSTEGCPNQSHTGGVCWIHGAKRKLCSSEGCTNQSYRGGGVCQRHGARKRLCSTNGCTNQVVKRGESA